MKNILFGLFILMTLFVVGCSGNLSPKEQALVITMDDILTELSIDPNGDHKILSRNFEVQGDSLSGSIEARTNEVLDLNSLKSQLLAGTSGWESGDVSIEGDSLDITFEKDYPIVEVEGVKYIPSSSVTLSVTVEDDGFTDANYDIDITLEEVESEEETETEEVEEVEIEESENDDE